MKLRAINVATYNDLAVAKAEAAMADHMADIERTHRDRKMKGGNNGTLLLKR